MKNALRCLTVLLAMFGLFACHDTDGFTHSEDVVVLPVQGLKILDLQPGFSFTASFARGQNIIYIQAVRGIPAPEEYRNTPGYPAYEIDVRVIDQDGRLLYIRKGGDAFVDPTWEDDLIWQDTLPSLGPNTHLFELLAQASEAMVHEFARVAGTKNASEFIHDIQALQ